MRESGSIEQDADLVLMLYREDYYKSFSNSSVNSAEIILAKHRNGPLGTIKLGFNPNYTRFTNQETR